MDDDRRSLTAALSRTPEVEQFLRGDKAKPAKPNPQPKRQEIPDSGEDQAEKVTAITPEQKEKSPADPIAGRIQRAKKKPTEKPVLTPLSKPLVAITTRFQPETADALRRASLERKLASKTPWTQQEIIEAAVKTWLAQTK